MITKDVATSRAPTAPDAERRRRPDDPYLLGLNGPFLDVVGQSTSSCDDAKRVVQEAQTLMRESSCGTAERVSTAPERTSDQPRRRRTAERAGGGRLHGRPSFGLMASVFCFVLTIGIAYFGQRFRARRRARAAVRAAKAGPPPVADQRKPETKRPARRPAPEDEPEDVDPLAPGFPEKAGPDRARSGAEWLPDRDRDHELVTAVRTKNAAPGLLHVPVKVKVRSRNS